MAKGEGIIEIKFEINGNLKTRKLHNVLYVPNLSYNLLSVSMAVKSGKTVEFSENECQIMSKKLKPIATARKIGNLYYLNCINNSESIYIAGKEDNEIKWHRRYGHLGTDSLKRLVRDEMVNGLNYNVSKEIGFCKPCIEGKHHRQKFPTKGGKRANDLLELVHTDVCGKMEVKTLGGKEYFVTFNRKTAQRRVLHFKWSYVYEK